MLRLVVSNTLPRDTPQNRVLRGAGESASRGFDSDIEILSPIEGYESQRSSQGAQLFRIGLVLILILIVTTASLWYLFA